MPKIAQNGQICPFVCCFFLYFAWRWGIISNWRSRFFLGKFSLAQNQVKMSKMAQFVHLSVTTAFFSGLAHTLGRIWLAAFVFIYLCIARIFVTDTKSIYNTIQYLKLTEPIFLGKFFFEKITTCLKASQNDTKCSDLSVRPLQQGLTSLPYIFAIWLFLVGSLPSFSKKNCDNFFQHTSFLNYRFFKYFLSPMASGVF